MKLTEHTIEQFVKVVASDAPAPGGGSASALAGTIGISLGTMVAGLTIGKQKYLQHDETMKEIIAKGDVLANELLESIDKDTDAFIGVTNVFSMPKETDQDKENRKVAMQSALKVAAEVPMEVMRKSLASLELIQKAVGCSNTNAASDLGVAALNLKSAVQGAWLNVIINLGGIKDVDFANEMREEGTEVLNKSCTIADNIYEAILKSL